MKKYIFLTCLFFSVVTFAQTGGKSVYSFLNVPTSAKSSSAGGSVVSLRGDLQFIADNPASLDTSVSNDIILSYINFIGDINFGNVAYAKHSDKLGVTIAGYLTYANYGDFIETNNLGEEIGEFKARDYNLGISFSKPVNDYFNVGISLKNIYSSLETYKSYGIGGDIGGSYLSKNKTFSAGAVISNFGSQIVSYTSGNKEQFPYELKAGFSKKLGHAPFRFSVFTNNLQKWDLTNSNGVNSSDSTIRFFTFDKFMRHLVINAEIIPSDNFYINISYDYKRRQDLKLSSRGGFIGFAFGTGIRVKMFELSYSRSIYHFAGASNHISITTNFDNLKKKVLRKNV
jgi:hypothetical protein